MTCLDDETVLGLCEGRLGAAELAAIEAHLDVCAACRAVITQFSRSQVAARELARGETLGRYVIGELVGSGAMGRVYSAWQPELDRRVAIKVLQDETPDARERLVREAQAMARLGHPNIVGVHEVGTTDDGVYVVMELVDGEPLRACVERPRPWRDTTRALLDVARGLAAVHAAGVVHRDVKPDNAILGADGRARLGDFGLARADADPALPIDGPATTTAIAGTPAYMALEVLRGAPASPASDQFSFGVTAYEALAGRRPFTGATWTELTRALAAGQPPPLRGVPGWLDAAVRRCLAADPTRRFPSMAAVAAHLATHLHGRRTALWIAAAACIALTASAATFLATHTTTPRCDSADQLVTLWDAPTRARLAPLGAPTLAAIDRWTAAWTHERDAACRAAQSSPAPEIAARDRCLERRRSELDALLARAATRPAAGERLVDALAELPPSDCRTATPGAALPLPLDPALADAARAVQAELPAVRAAIALGDARPVLAAIADLATRARASGHAPTESEALLLHAEALRTTSQLPAAADAARDALAAAERGHDDLAAAHAWLARVTIAGERRDLAAADDLAAIAAAVIDRAGAPPRLAAQLLRTRGLTAFNRGRLAAARTLLADARARFVASTGARSLEIAAIESSLGAVARAAGDLDLAERHHRDALARARELRGDRHPDIARELHNLAGVLRLRGDLDGAVALYDEALAIELATRGESSVAAALTRNSLGLVHMARHDWTAARAALSSARDALAAAGHGDLAFAEHNLGLVAAATGDHPAARDHFTRAAAAYAATIGGDASGPIRLALDQARTDLALGDLARARTHAAHASDAARRADIAWIAAEADALTATLAPAKPATRPRPAPPVATSPVSRSLAPPPQPPPPKPRPDVGVYGSSQSW